MHRFLMDIASVINSYELTGEVNLFGQVARINSGRSYRRDWRYRVADADKPTITYQPLAGDKFTRNLMLPIPIPSILYLIQSGYPADLVLRICVDSINGLHNSFGGQGRPQAAIPNFVNLFRHFVILKLPEVWGCEPRLSKRDRL